MSRSKSPCKPMNMSCDCKTAQGTIHDLKMKLTKLLQPCNKYLNHSLWKTIWYPQIAQSYNVLIVLLVRKFLSYLLLNWHSSTLIFSLPKKKKIIIIKLKLLEFAFACDDLFPQGTDIFFWPLAQKHRMVQPLIWQDQMSCMSCSCRCASRDTASNSHLNSTFLETRQQQRCK